MKNLKVLIACEHTGIVRDAFIAAGHDAISADILPTEAPGPHYQGDVRDLLNQPWDLIIAHPPCTYLTTSAEWAYKDPDFDRYPEIGYHQKVKPGTLTGEARRQARKEALEFVAEIWAANSPRICIENPKGVINSELYFMPTPQYIQPYCFGHDASKLTGLWLKGVSYLQSTDFLDLPVYCCGMELDVDAVGIYGCANCEGDNHPYLVYRASNQTPSGQCKIGPSEDRWKARSATFQGVADAMAQQWGAA